jgi:site-specific DNA-methyltransferase (cytosine-N4-specific)
MAAQRRIEFPDPDGSNKKKKRASNLIKALLARKKFEPYYVTQFGKAYLGDSRELLKALPSNCISLVMTSPPFALRKKKNYGNPDAEDYVAWFRPFAEQVKKVLTDDGSFVIELGGGWNEGEPTRSIYQYELLIDLVKQVGFHLSQEFFWFNPAKMPSPAQWVNIERVRCIDAVNTIWWLSKTERPKANNKNVLQEYSASMKKLIARGTYNEGRRPSGHVVSDKWNIDHGGAIPKNLIVAGNTTSIDVYQQYCRDNKIPLHPARFPRELPQFFVNFLTDSKNDVVLDIFAGSNVTGSVCEELGRSWLAFEQRTDFIEASKCRFELPVDLDIARQTTVEPSEQSSQFQSEE